MVSVPPSDLKDTYEELSDAFEDAQSRAEEVSERIDSVEDVSEDLFEECGIQLESEQVETVGGYISEQLGRVPETGESLELQGHTFLMKEADVKQMQWVLVTRQQAS